MCPNDRAYPLDGMPEKSGILVSEPEANPRDGMPEKSILSCEPIAYQSDGDGIAGIAIATANERLILLLSKNFDDEVEIRSEPKLDVSGRMIKFWPLNMNICGILMLKWYK